MVMSLGYRNRHNTTIMLDEKLLKVKKVGSPANDQYDQRSDESNLPFVRTTKKIKKRYRNGDNHRPVKIRNHLIEFSEEISFKLLCLFFIILHQPAVDLYPLH